MSYKARGWQISYTHWYMITQDSEHINVQIAIIQRKYETSDVDLFQGFNVQLAYFLLKQLVIKIYNAT